MDVTMAFVLAALVALCLCHAHAFGIDQGSHAVEEWAPKIQNPNLNTLLFYTCVTPQIGNQCEEGSC